MSADVWVLGSGPTLDWVPLDFWDGRTIVATNRVADRLGLYDRANVITHTHYHEDAKFIADKYPEAEVWCPEGDGGHAGTPDWDRSNVRFYPHPPTRFNFDPAKAWKDDGLIVGSTSLHGAMHLACEIGATTVFLSGADCGRLDGVTNMAGYVSGDLVHNDPDAWMARWDAHLRLVKGWLLTLFDVSIVSLNPFVNLNLEGHTWTGVRS